MNDEAEPVPGPIPPAADARAAAFTGLVVTHLPAHGAWRVHTRGPLETRPFFPAHDPSSWNRFEVTKPSPFTGDTPDELPGSLYAGTERRAAYAEVLAHLRWPKVDELEALAAEVLIDVDSGTAITDDWDELGFDPPGTLEDDWCSRRKISLLSQPASETVSYVDVEHHESMAALNIVCKSLLIRNKALPLNVSLLRSTRREITCGISTEVATCTLTLSNGQRASGFRYLSQHSTGWECWVTWPANDYSGLQADHTEPVSDQDEDLLYILELFRLALPPKA